MLLDDLLQLLLSVCVHPCCVVLAMCKPAAALLVRKSSIATCGQSATATHNEALISIPEQSPAHQTTWLEVLRRHNIMPV